jgi:hypothetical protein
MPGPSVSQILVELSSTFGAEIGRRGCTLAPDANAKFEELFGKTVAAGLGDTTEAWTPSAERYIVKVVGRIAEDACVVARKLHHAEVTGTILGEVASDVIAEQQLVCHRVEEMAAKKNPVAPAVALGRFCKTYF